VTWVFDGTRFAHSSYDKVARSMAGTLDGVDGISGTRSDGNVSGTSLAGARGPSSTVKTTFGLLAGTPKGEIRKLSTSSLLDGGLAGAFCSRCNIHPCGSFAPVGDWS